MHKQLLLSLTLVSSLSLMAFGIPVEEPPMTPEEKLELFTGFYPNMASRTLYLNSPVQAATICRVAARDTTQRIVINEAGIAIRSDGTRVTLKEIEAARLEATARSYGSDMVELVLGEDVGRQTCLAFVAFLNAQETAIQAQAAVAALTAKLAATEAEVSAQE